MSLLCRGPTGSLAGPGVTGNSPVSESYKTSTSFLQSPKYSRDLKLLPAVLLVFLPGLFLFSCLGAVDTVRLICTFLLVSEVLTGPFFAGPLLSCLDSHPALLSRSGGNRARVARRAAPSERISARVAPAVASGATIPGRGRGHVRKGRGGQFRYPVCVPFCYLQRVAARLDGSRCGVAMTKRA